MKCPFCNRGDFAVVDSRQQRDGFGIRRRRVCDQCKRKVWTLESIVDVPLQVVKKDETREPFNPEKIRRGLEKALYKRPVSAEQVDLVISEIQSEVHSRYFGEVPVAVIGDLVMDRLQQLDQVAYIRFASVYREFKDVSEFMNEVRPMLQKNGKRGSRRDQPDASPESEAAS